MLSAIPPDIQVHLGRIEADLKERSAQVEALTAQLEQTKLEKGQLEDQVESINVLLEASHNRDVDEDTEVSYQIRVRVSA